jgi:hypothetical protein
MFVETLPDSAFGVKTEEIEERRVREQEML